MHLQQIQIRNLRSISESVVAFTRPTEGNATLLLGGNGAGKSSVLRAVALACLGPSLLDSGFVPYRLVRERARGTPPTAKIEARVVLTPQDEMPGAFSPGDELDLSIAIERSGRGTDRRERVAGTRCLRVDRLGADLSREFGDALFASDLSSFLVFGYGATRRIEPASNVDSSARAKSRGARFQRVAGLFEEGATLMPLSFWLPAFQQRNPGRAKQVATLINRLLPPECRFDPVVKETEGGFDFMFRMNGDPVPFAALSDGYRAYIGWVADLLYHITQGAQRGSRLDETQGIVLVDEIDLHLHPEWQRVVVPTLAAALPQMQFVLTSHSPLVAASLNKEHVRVLQAAPAGTTVDELNESIRGRTVDQLLRSPYFGLDSTRDVGTESELRSLARRARGGDVQASLQYLEKLSGAEVGVESAEPDPPAYHAPRAKAPARKSAARKAPASTRTKPAGRSSPTRNK